jgi:hypothetical protein
MKPILLLLIPFVLLLPVPAQVSEPASKPLTLPAPAHEEPKKETGWWDSFNEKKWEFSFTPGEMRFGLRIPIYPLLSCIVLIVILMGVLESAKQRKRSAVVPGIIYAATIVALLGLLWKAAYREPKTPPKPMTWLTPRTDDILKALEPPKQIPIPPNSLLSPDPNKPGSRASDLLKDGFFAPKTTPQAPPATPPSNTEAPPKPPNP